jgi:hypothetical protein
MSGAKNPTLGTLRGRTLARRSRPRIGTRTATISGALQDTKTHDLPICWGVGLLVVGDPPNAQSLVFAEIYSWLSPWLMLAQ